MLPARFRASSPAEITTAQHEQQFSGRSSSPRPRRELASFRCGVVRTRGFPRSGDATRGGMLSGHWREASSSTEGSHVRSYGLHQLQSDGWLSTRQLLTAPGTASSTPRRTRPGLLVYLHLHGHGHHPGVDSGQCWRLGEPRYQRAALHRAHAAVVRWQLQSQQLCQSRHDQLHRDGGRWQHVQHPPGGSSEHDAERSAANSFDIGQCK